jgi:hypothetical protein
MLRLMTVAAAGLFAGLGITSAWSADLAPRHHHHHRAWAAAATTDTSVLPACDDPAVTRSLARQFAGTQGEYWNSDARIVRFGTPFQIGYRTWGRDFIIRRFCGAPALVDNGDGRRPRRTAAYYQVVDHGGLAGVGWAVDWCVVGYDRNFAYQPACKMLRP